MLSWEYQEGADRETHFITGGDEGRLCDRAGKTEGNGWGYHSAVFYLFMIISVDRAGYREYNQSIK